MSRTVGNWGYDAGEWFEGDFATMEEAAREGIKHARDNEIVFVAQYCAPKPIEDFFQASNLFESIEEHEDYSSDDQVVHVTDEVEAELEATVRAAIRDWRLKHKVLSNWVTTNKCIPIMPDEKSKYLTPPV